jgi:hypothetical protein
MCRCGEGVIATSGARVSRAITQRCRAWTCDECLPRRRNQLIALGCAGDPTRFLTFTVIHRPGESPLIGAKLLTASFRTFLKLLKRKYPTQRLEYLAVMEAHKDGWPHLHVLARGPWIDVEWMREQWKRLTGAHRIGLEKPKTKRGVAAYIGKYIGKAPHKFGTLKRYWQSKAWDKRRKRSKREGLDFDETWQVLHDSLNDWVQKRVYERRVFTWLRAEYVLAEKPP